MSSAELAISHNAYLSFDGCSHYTAVLRFLSFIKHTSHFPQVEHLKASHATHLNTVTDLIFCVWMLCCTFYTTPLLTLPPSSHFALFHSSVWKCWNVALAVFADAKTKEIVLIELICACEFPVDVVMSGVTFQLPDTITRISCREKSMDLII